MKIEYILELIEEHATAAVRRDGWRESEVMKEIKEAIELYAAGHSTSKPRKAAGKNVMREAHFAATQDDFECLQAEWRREHKLIMDTRPVE